MKEDFSANFTDGISAFKKLEIAMKEMGFLTVPSRSERLIERLYYKVRRIGYLTATIPMVLIKGFFHGIKDAWSDWEYDN